MCLISYVYGVYIHTYCIFPYCIHCIYCIYCIYVCMYVHLCMFQGEPVKGLHILAIYRAPFSTNVWQHLCVCDDVFDVMSYLIVVVVCL